MDIPKAPSSPRDPAQVSFLTLPAEVRNMVYDILFARNEPVKVHNIRAYYAQGPIKPKLRQNRNSADDEGGDDDTYEPYVGNRGNSRYGPAYVLGNARGIVLDKRQPTMKELYRDRLRQYHERITVWKNLLATEKPQLREFDHGFVQGFGLQISCRQIHHEAAGVLYGKNTFMLTRMQSGHDCPQYRLDDAPYHQFNYAPVWLQNLGTQAGFLNKVSIDLSAVCGIRDGCQHATYRSIEILPLLKAMWKNPLATYELTFIHAGRSLTTGSSRFGPDAVSKLNRILVLRLKKTPWASGPSSETTNSSIPSLFVPRLSTTQPLVE